MHEYYCIYRLYCYILDGTSFSYLQQSLLHGFLWGFADGDGRTAMFELMRDISPHKLYARMGGNDPNDRFKRHIINSITLWAPDVDGCPRFTKGYAYSTSFVPDVILYEKANALNVVAIALVRHTVGIDAIALQQLKSELVSHLGANEKIMGFVITRTAIQVLFFKKALHGKTPVVETEGKYFSLNRCLNTGFVNFCDLFHQYVHSV